MRIEPEELKRLLDYAYIAHQEKSTRDPFRQEGKLPFVIHPVWCALTLLNDNRVPFADRQMGYQALLLHDVLEDTSAGLPDFISPEVAVLVKEMTYQTWEEEQAAVLKKSPLLKLMKLLDKTATMYDEGMKKGGDKKKREWKVLTAQLVQHVEKEYGNIRAVTLAKALLQNTDW